MHGTYKYEFTMHFGLVPNNNLDENDKSLYGRASKASPRAFRVKTMGNVVKLSCHLIQPWLAVNWPGL